VAAGVSPGPGANTGSPPSTGAGPGPLADRCSKVAPV
jgi:hypothetical protein